MTEVETLLSQAVAAVEASDLRTAADRFERAGRILAGVRDDDAVHALTSAARLYLLAEDPPRARAVLERARGIAPADVRVARLHAELVDVGGEPIAREEAWLAVLATDVPAEQHHARLRLAALAREVGVHAHAADQFAAILAALPADADADERVELLLEIATSRTAAADLDGAAAALADAEAALPPGEAAPAPGAAADAAAAVALQRARIGGQQGVLALARGDHAGALRHGEAAREVATRARDVLTYLGACSLIAMVHEQTGQLVDAYDTYVRARESLADLLGDGARPLVDPAIALFETRLGPAAFAEVWTAWVARRRAGTTN